LCTEGAQTALATTYLAIPSAVVGWLMTPGCRPATGTHREEGPYSAGP